MKKIHTYGEMLESIKNSKRIFEQAMMPEKISKLKRLKDAGDVPPIVVRESRAPWTVRPSRTFDLSSGCTDANSSSVS